MKQSIRGGGYLHISHQMGALLIVLLFHKIEFTNWIRAPRAVQRIKMVVDVRVPVFETNAQLSNSTWWPQIESQSIPTFPIPCPWGWSESSNSKDETDERKGRVDAVRNVACHIGQLKECQGGQHR